MTKKKIITLLFAVFISGSLFSQTINKPKLDSLINTLVIHDKAMGSLAISRNGMILYSKAFGISSVNQKIKINSNEKTKYRIGSITNMFTATMIFQAVEEGKITLSTTLNTYFPQLPNSKTITISHLLNHRSGLHNFTRDPDYNLYKIVPKSGKEMLAILSRYKADFPPGLKARFSNSNYVILGFILEKIYGKPYREILKQKITSVLCLNDTYCGGKTNILKNESLSYRYLTSWIQENETDLSVTGGAGSIVSTPSDLTCFIEALFSKKLISKGSLNKMTSLKDGFGSGIFQFYFGNRKAWGYNGGIDGYGSSLCYFPSENLVVCYCTNGQVYPMYDILSGIINICFNLPYKIPVFNSYIPADAYLDSCLGVYSSGQLFLKITITKEKNTLIAQATGNAPFPLDPAGRNIFTYDKDGIKIEFYPYKNEMIVHQDKCKYKFIKEK
jgi:D-alanyl-D-alanine carboxypeptidase